MNPVSSLVLPHITSQGRPTALAALPEPRSGPQDKSTGRLLALGSPGCPACSVTSVEYPVSPLPGPAKFSHFVASCKAYPPIATANGKGQRRLLPDWLDRCQFERSRFSRDSESGEAARETTMLLQRRGPELWFSFATLTDMTTTTIIASMSARASTLVPISKFCPMHVWSTNLIHRRFQFQPPRVF